MMKAVVVDDEEYGRQAIVSLLADYCPEVEVIGTADTALSAIKEIKAKKPDVIFLDVEMPHGNGFNVLENVSDMDFEVIFTTAYDHYAIQAIKFSAIDYLLKPIDHEELIAAVKRAAEKRNSGKVNENFKALIENIRPDRPNRKLSLPTQDGFMFVDIFDIIRVEGSGNYSLFFLVNGEKILVSKTLRDFEKLLSESGFFRIHQSHLINLRQVVKYLRGRGGSVEMKDGIELEVSRRRKEEFLDAMDNVVSD